MTNFKAALPEGVRIINAYMVELGQADHRFEIVYELDGYAALDNWNMNNPKFKDSFQKFVLDLGFFASEVQTHYIRSVDDVHLLDQDVFDEVTAKEKERST